LPHFHWQSLGHGKIPEKKLNQKGSIAEKLHVSGGNPVQGLECRESSKTKECAQSQGDNRADKGYFKGNLESVYQIKTKILPIGGVNCIQYTPVKFVSKFKYITPIVNRGQKNNYEG
jgi:hypothetical protein